MKYATVSIGHSPRVITFQTEAQAREDAEKHAKFGATVHVVEILATCEPLPREVQWVKPEDGEA